MLTDASCVFDMLASVKSVKMTISAILIMTMYSVIVHIEPTDKDIISRDVRFFSFKNSNFVKFEFYLYFV